MMGFTPVIVGLIISALLFFYLFIRNIRRRRPVRGGLNFFLSLLTGVVAALLIAISINLYTYSRLTNERIITRLVFNQQQQNIFNLTMVGPDNTRRSFTLKGDEWILEARLLKWKGWANLLGLDSQYRLERISGRYSDTEDQNSHFPTAWSLVDNKGFDLWKVARKYPQWLPVADASYGSATYLPMIDQVEYEVSVSQSGLLARPVNGRAQSAVTNWQ